MKKRELNAMLKRITTKNKLDIDKIPTLSDDERGKLVVELVKKRLPVVVDLIPDGFDMPWLRCCGYFYTQKNERYTFLCTCENRLIVK